MTSPKFIMSDFAQSLILSIERCFSSQHFGCFFHFMQAITKNLRQKTTKTREERKEIIEIIRSEVISSKKANILKSIKRFKIPEFLKYFKRTWVKKLPPILWDFSYRPDEMKGNTNNSLEREFRSLKTAVGLENNLDIFISKLYYYCIGKLNNNNSQKVFVNYFK